MNSEALTGWGTVILAAGTWWGFLTDRLTINESRTPKIGVTFCDTKEMNTACVKSFCNGVRVDKCGDEFRFHVTGTLMNLGEAPVQAYRLELYSISWETTSLIDLFASEYQVGLPKGESAELNLSLSRRNLKHSSYPQENHFFMGPEQLSDCKTARSGELPIAVVIAFKDSRGRNLYSVFALKSNPIKASAVASPLNFETHYVGTAKGTFNAMWLQKGAESMEFPWFMKTRTCARTIAAWPRKTKDRVVTAFWRILKAVATRHLGENE